MVPTGWETIAAQHTVWGRVEDAQAHRERAVALAGRLAEERHRAAAALPDDPWLGQDADSGAAQGAAGSCSAEVVRRDQVKVFALDA